MAKSVKRTSEEMNKNISVREASRRAQNERRKAQRRLAKTLSEETGVKINWKEAYEYGKSLEDISYQSKSLISTIESLRAKTVEGKKSKRGYSVDIGKTAEAISTFTQMRFGVENLSKKSEPINLYRKNKMTEYQLNQATRKEGLSIFESNKTHGFYAATSYMWNTADSSDNKNALIMQEFGLTDLRQVYDLIVNKDLKAKDFGFTDEEVFQTWLNEIRKRVPLDEIREIFKDEMTYAIDEAEPKYDKIRVGNIKMLVDRLFL